MTVPDAKKNFILTATFAEQEALLRPPNETVGEIVLPRPAADTCISTQEPTAPAAEQGTPVHRFVIQPTAHPGWSDFLARALALGLSAWHAHAVFRLAMVALHGADGRERAEALAHLASELDAWLRPNATLVVGPISMLAPSASPVASPALPSLNLFAGLPFPETTPELVASMTAALTGWATWHAPSFRLFAPEHQSPPPLDLVLAMATAAGRPVERVPLPAPAAPEVADPFMLVASGVLILELQGARALATHAPADAIAHLPAIIRRASIPAVRVALMNALSDALRRHHGLPPPPSNAPGLLAQITARLQSPLAAVADTALAELDALARAPDPLALGLDLPTRYPDALATARRALAESKDVPRWVIANTEGADRGLLCAALMGRLPSADGHLLQALADLAPTDLGPALAEMARVPWIDDAGRRSAQSWLARLGRAP
jgi:hypothetical protein